MTPSRRRIGAVLRADFLERFRKPSTVVVFLVLCFSAYFWIPDPSASYTLISVQGQRVLYDSPAVAFGTAILFSILMTLFGFFIVKGSIGRDLRSRCGLVVASTPTANWEYLAGKCLGNMGFLTTLAVGYLSSAMVMQLVRGEAPLDPVPYLILYALFVPPGIVFVSVVAVLFESTPRLAGRGGEVLYFFLWTLLLGVSIGWHTRGASPGLYFDVTSVGFLEQLIREGIGSEGVSIGTATYDATLPPLVFTATRVETVWILQRIASSVTPLPLFLLAMAVFHRFDPARSRVTLRRRGPSLMDRLAKGVRKPGSVVFSRLVPRLGRQRSWAGATASEALLTLLLHPLGASLLSLFALFSLIAPLQILAGLVLPAIFAILAVTVAGASSRERRSGTAVLIASIPGLEQRYLWWKLSAALSIGFVFAAAGALRLGLASPAGGLSVMVGLFFTAAAATSIGVLAGTPRAFVVLFLSFWYVALNDGGRTAALDFAGFFGTATSSTRIFYLALAILLLLAAQGVRLLRRRPGRCARVARRS